MEYLAYVDIEFDPEILCMVLWNCMATGKETQ